MPKIVIVIIVTREVLILSGAYVSAVVSRIILVSGEIV